MERTFSIEHRKSEKYENKPSYMGGFDQLILFMLIIFQKRYSSISGCTTLLKDINHTSDFMIWYSMAEEKLFCSEYWTDDFNKLMLNKGCRYIFQHLNIIFPTGGSHSGFLLIDKEEKSIQRYDPHGEYSKELITNMKAMDRIIKKYFILPGYIEKYISPSKYCVYGPQHHQELEQDVEYFGSGYCTMWTFWNLELRLNYPELSLKELEKKIGERFQHYKLKGVSLSKIIYNYSLYYIRKLERLFNMNVSDIRKLPNDESFQFIIDNIKNIGL